MDDFCVGNNSSDADLKIIDTKDIKGDPECLEDSVDLREGVKKQAENGLQSRSSENGKTAVWHYELKLQ